MPITLPPVVVTGDIISAAYANATRSALMFTYSELYSFSQPVDANGHSIVGIGTVSTDRVVVGIDITVPTITVTDTLTAQNVTVAGSFSIANLSISGTVATANAVVTSVLNATSINATSLAGGSISGTSLLLSSAGDTPVSVVSTGTIQSVKIQLVARQASVNDEWNIVATGSALAPPALRFVRGSWTGAPSLQILATGQVGIGSVAPAATLHLSASTPSLRLSDTVNDGYTFYRDSPTGEFNFLGDQSGVSAFRFTTKISGVNTEVVKISNSGRVGIGTSSPVQKLHLSGGDSNVIRCDDSVNGVLFQVGSAGGGSLLGTYSVNPLTILTDSIPRMIFGSSGAITLIGTTAMNAVAPVGSPGSQSSALSIGIADGGSGIYLETVTHRINSGTGHGSIDTHLRRRVDSTLMGYVGFGTNYVSIGTAGGAEFVRWSASGRMKRAPLTTYGSNALAVAGGLSVGEEYWTPTGEMRIVI